MSVDNPSRVPGERYAGPLAASPERIEREHRGHGSPMRAVSDTRFVAALLTVSSEPTQAEVGRAAIAALHGLTDGKHQAPAPGHPAALTWVEWERRARYQLDSLFEMVDVAGWDGADARPASSILLRWLDDARDALHRLDALAGWLERAPAWPPD